MTYITTAQTYVIAPQAYGILIQVNGALTGTLTVADGRGIQAVITNPTGGSFYRYYGLQGPVSVANSAIADVTVSTLSHQGA